LGFSLTYFSGATFRFVKFALSHQDIRTFTPKILFFSKSSLEVLFGKFIFANKPEAQAQIVMKSYSILQD
jgi:hypothetical protein